MSNRVTIKEQETLGIRRTNYVPAMPEAHRNEIVVSQPTHTPRTEIMPTQPITVDVVPTSTTQIIMKTSAVDRAKGFLIASTPRTFAVSLGITLLAIAIGGIGVAGAITLLVGLFGLIEATVWVYTLSISPEGVSKYEARRKWDIVEREQKKRWQHYERGEE